MNANRTLLLFGLVAVVLAASASVPVLRGLGGDEAGDVPIYVVERGDFVRKIHADGNLKAADATPLGPPTQARRSLKIAWLAPDGSAVAAGDVVIRFDSTDMEDELREGRHEAATTDTRIAAKSVRDEGSRRNLERDAEVASLELDYARSYQSKDALIFSRREIVESEIDEKLAIQKRDHAQGAGAVHHELSQTELDLLAIERRKAELQIAEAQQALQALEVRAPHDGIFVLQSTWGRKPEVGQMVWRGNSVAEIPKPETMEARVYVLEADAGGLEEGLTATVVIDAHPDVVYQAKVSQVAALAQRRNHRVPIQYFTVTLELERTDTALMKPGQRVQVVLLLDEREDVLSVPRQAVFEKDGKKIIYVRREGRFEPTEVTTGPSALGRLLIEDGLSQGDRIALRDPTRPVDGPLEEDQESESFPIS
jgi:multidrug resistance efflux pump